MGPADAPSPRNVAAVESLLDTAVRQARDRISELRPDIEWQLLTENATSPCNTSDGPGGTWHTTGLNMAAGVGASHSEWPAWKTAVDDVLTGHGFTTPTEVSPEGASHMLKYTNPEGDVVTFSTNPRGTSLDGRSSCFLAGPG